MQTTKTYTSPENNNKRNTKPNTKRNRNTSKPKSATRRNHPRLARHDNLQNTHKTLPATMQQK